MDGDAIVMSRRSQLRDDFFPAQVGIAGPLFANRAPIAAAGDPESSHQSAHELTASGKRDAQKKQVLEALVGMKQAVTSAELAEWAVLDRHMVARRLPDLEADLLVRRAGKRNCRITGHEAIVWEEGK